jgi:hypothetical protein
MNEERQMEMAEAMNLAMGDEPCPALSQAIAEITAKWKPASG